jgi:Folded gastrulation N-terminus
MRLISILIILFVCYKTLCKALPVQSPPVEEGNDQFIWQQQWFSHDNNQPSSPFASNSKKITAKSIFIAPSFVQVTQYCPPDHRIDNGKCIKVVNINSDNILATRLANLLTTDDTANFDYDYSQEDESEEEVTSNNDDALKLSLVPILNDDDENNSNIDNGNHSEDEMTFRTENKTHSVEIIITTLSSDYGATGESNETVTYEHENATTYAEEFNAENSTTTAAMDENTTEINSTVMQQDEDSQSIELTTLATQMDVEFNSSEIFTSDDGKTATEVTIIDTSSDLNSFLLNDSLIIATVNNVSDADYVDTTTTIIFTDITIARDDKNISASSSTTEESTLDNEQSHVHTTTATTTTLDEESTQPDLDTESFTLSENKNDDRRNAETAHKFVYHHSHTTSSTESAASRLRFPTEREEEKSERSSSRVRFPDDDNRHTPVVWTPARESGRQTSNIFRFWQQQPLIRDVHTRPNAKSFRAEQFYPFTRKVQVMTPQRYNYD